VEVALSILAEIVQTQVSEARKQPPAPAPAAATSAVDPVCGMSVNIATARHTADLDGASYYFCCANCRSRFLENPRAYPART
jgi:YHS domain-containing protein